MERVITLTKAQAACSNGSLGFANLVDEHLQPPADAVGRANGGTKALTVIGAMLAGGGSISDTEVLRAGSCGQLLDRPPGAIDDRDVAARVHLGVGVDVGQGVAPGAGPRVAGLGPDLDGDLTVDFDSTICRVFGTAKQGARFGYTGVRGCHPLLATLAGAGEVLPARMRGGNAGAARGAGSFVRETISRLRSSGARGKLIFRANSAFYSRAFVTACRDHDVAFSVTAKTGMAAIRRAIEQIDEHAWTPIPYWLEGGADVAETTFTAFKRHPR